MTDSVLYDLFPESEISMVPGAGSPLDVLMIEQAGFKAAGIGGFGVAAQQHGVPDVGLIAFEEMRRMIDACRQVSDLPLLVDCDTGYGGIQNIRQMVQSFESMAVAFIEIEDQTWPKRCGLMDGVTVAPIDDALRRIDAALAARRGNTMLISARTDACKSLGFEEAMRRCERFKEAGADTVYLHSAQSHEELKTFAQEISGLKTVCVGEGECADTCSLETLRDWGFQMAAAPSSLLRSSITAMQKTLQDLRRTDGFDKLASDVASPEDVIELLGMNGLQAFEDGLERS